MGRAKLPIKLITPERSRNATFLKRRKGLKKKIYEFATLCGVDACLIIYGPAPGSISETWPEDRGEVARIVDRFEKAPKEERDKRKQDISSFLRSKNQKLQEELEKMKRENAELASMLLWNGSGLESMDLSTVQELQSRLDSKIKEIDQVRARVKMIDVKPHRGSQSQPSGKTADSHFEALPSGMDHRQPADYVQPLRSYPPSTPLVSPMTPLYPQDGHSNNLVPFNGPDCTVVEPSSRCIAGLGSYFSDPVPGYPMPRFGCVCGSPECILFMANGAMDYQYNYHLPSNFSYIPPTRTCSNPPPFSFPVQDHFDPLLGQIDPTPWIDGFDSLDYAFD